MRGSGWSTASTASVMGRSVSYSTSIRSSAAVAISSLTAATAATGSPTKRTLSSASACSSWLTGRMPKGIGRSAPVSTAFTPCKASALEPSTERMRACGCGLRSSLQKSMRGRNKSSANLVTPVTFAVASSLRWALPIIRRTEGGTDGGGGGGGPDAGLWFSFRSFPPPVAFLLEVAIQRLWCRRRVLAPQACCRQFHCLVDLDVAGAAAQVAGQRLLDLL